MKDDELAGWTLVLALARVADLERENAKMKQALGSIAHYVTENWAMTYFHPELQRILEDAGYDICEPGEPEPFIHGDTDTGAEG